MFNVLMCDDNDRDYVAEAANDPLFIEPFTVCIGEQYPQPDGERGAMQKFYRADQHRQIITLGDLAELVAVSGETLPDDASKDDRKALKNRVPFLIMGGLKSGGMTQRLSREDKAACTEANPEHFAHAYRRIDDNMQSQPVLPLDFDNITPALFTALMGELNEFTGDRTGGVLAKYCGVAFCSPSHTPEAPRLKALIIAKEPVAPADKVTACLRLEAEIMAAAGCVRADAGGWLYQCELVECDPSQYRIAQVVYTTAANAERLIMAGELVDVDALPWLDAAAIAAVRANTGGGRFDENGEHRYPLPANPTPAQGWALAAGGKLIKPNFIAMPGLCPWSHLHSDPMDSKPGSWGLLLGGEVEHFCCKHAGCTAHRQELIADGKSANYQFAIDAGMPEELAAEIWGGANLRRDAADEFEDLTAVELTAAPAGGDAAPVAMIGGRAAFLRAKPGVNVIPYEEWDGKTGDPALDFLREKVAEAYGVNDKGEPAKHLRQIAPQVKPVYKKDVLTGGQPRNHADNIKWLLYRSGLQMARNLMTFELELFSLKTGLRVTHSEAKTLSFLIGQADKFSIPKEAIADHLTAVAEDAGYHPVRRALDAGGVWDGVPRVQRVIDCVPVKPAERKRRDALLWGLFAAAVAAVDSPTGSVAIKYVPTLYSEQNDFMKTSFWLRVFSLVDGAARTASLDPESTASLRKNLYSWFVEWGELESMGKASQGALKQHIGETSDQWKMEHARTLTTKKRQTVYGASCNIPDFIKEKSVASRFPVIALTGAIDLDAVNEILGWQYVQGEARRVDPMQHAQFFLEVRHLRDNGQLDHALPPEILAEVKAANVEYTDKGNHYDAIREYVAAHGDTIANDFTSSDMASDIGRPKTEARQVGKALALLVNEGLFSKRVKDGITRYSVVNPSSYAADLSVSA